MLSKLLSNINETTTPSGEELISGNEAKDGMSSSEQVFKSLLQALKNEGSSAKAAKQQLLSLSSGSSEQLEQEDAEGETDQKNILGGTFAVKEESSANNFQQADQNILQELQRELQHMKNELTGAGEGGDDPSESEEKVKMEQSSKNISGQDTENDEDKITGQNTVVPGNMQEGKELEVDANNDSNGDGVSKESDKKVEDSPKRESESKESGNGQKVVKQDQAPKMNFTKHAPENSEESEKGNTVSEGKGVENLKEANSNSLQNNHNTTSITDSNKSESSQKAQAFQRTNTSIDIEGTEQKSSEDKLQNDKVSEKGSTGEDIKSQEKTSQKDGVGGRKGDINNQGKLFEKVQDSGRRQVKQDVEKRTQETQKTTNKNFNDRAAQPGVQTDGSQSRQTTKTELLEQQKKVRDSFFQRNNTANISTKGLEMKGVQNEKSRGSKEKKESEQFQRGLGKQSVSEGRNKLLSRLGISSINAQKQAKPLNMQNFTGVSTGESSLSLEEQKINWEEQLSKTMDSANEKESQTNSTSMRLGQMPITNVSLRKKVLPGLTQRIQQAASSAKQNGDNWQKHTFTLDDGKNIQLSVRESKGVVQVKMGSMNLDLSKLLQQNLQQIREHLKQEFGTDIDLQFDNQQQGEESQFSGDTDQSAPKRNYQNNFAGESLAVENASDARTKTVRNFGYNQMEWTA